MWAEQLETGSLHGSGSTVLVSSFEQVTQTRPREAHAPLLGAAGGGAVLLRGAFGAGGGGGRCMRLGGGIITKFDLEVAHTPPHF